jgi:hypothetical protein
MDRADLQLRENEHVLWEASPPTGLNLASHDPILIPASLLWTGFFILFNVAAWADRANWVMRAWGAPFLLWGVYFVIGRFFADAWVRRRQRYFVTNRRVLIWRRGWRGGLTSLDIGWLPPLKVIERADGSGDIRFGLPRYRRSKSGQKVEKDRAAPALSPIPHFLGIADVAAVHALIERAAQG